MSGMNNLLGISRNVAGCSIDNIAGKRDWKQNHVSAFVLTFCVFTPHCEYTQYLTPAAVPFWRV